MKNEILKEEKIKEEIRILIREGFFNLKSGQVIINKNNGVIQDIKFITTPYKRKGKFLKENIEAVDNSLK